MSPDTRAALEDLRASLLEMDLEDDCANEEDERRVGRLWARAAVLVKRLGKEEAALEAGR